MAAVDVFIYSNGNGNANQIRAGMEEIRDDKEIHVC
jgi:hypothetical protein